MRVLPVSVPDLGTQYSDTPIHLARRVGAFFGVDTGETPGGQTWVMRYDALTLGEISRGGPLPTKAWHESSGAKAAGARPGHAPFLPRDTWWVIDHAVVCGTGTARDSRPAFDVEPVPIAAPHEISAATLNRFGPDSKAATVLTGANQLFASTVETIDQIFTTVKGANPDLDPMMHLAMWAALMQEAYRSQPALFAAAAQARSIQRALGLRWAPVHGFPERAARGEFRPDDAVPTIDPQLAPRDLVVLDETLRAHVDIGRMFPGGPANASYLRDDVAARWSTHLLESGDRGYIWITEPAPGRATAEVFTLTYATVGTFLTQQFQLRPLELDRDESSWSRYLPVIPSDVSHLSKETVATLIWLLVQVCRILRSEPFRGVAFGRAVRGRLRDVVALAEQALGPLHVMTLWAANRLADALFADTKHTDPLAATRAALEESRSLTRLRAKRRDGALGAGLYAEMLMASVATLRQARDTAARRDDPAAAELADALQTAWDEFFAAIDVDLPSLLDGTAPPALLDALGSHLHNYTVVLARSGDARRALTALRVGRDIVLPARRAAAGGRRSDSIVRVALQVCIRNVDEFARLEDADPAARSEWLDWALERAAELEGLEYTRDVLIQESRLVASQVNTLSSVVRGRILALERGREIPLEETGRLVDRLATARGLVPGSAPDPNASDPLWEAHALMERFAARVPRPPFRVLASAAAEVSLDANDAGSTSTWTGEFADNAFTVCLREAARRASDAWPAFTLTREPDPDTDSVDRLRFRLDEPFVSRAIESVVLRIRGAEATAEIPLTIVRTPDYPVQLEGVLPAVAEWPGAISLEVVLRARG